MQLIYVSNGNDASDNGCYIFAGFKVLFSVTGMTMPVTLLQVFRCYFLLLVCWWIFLYITIMQVPSDCFLLQLCMQLARSFYSTYAGDSFCSKYSWELVTSFIVIMQMGVCCNYMHVVF